MSKYAYVFEGDGRKRVEAPEGEFPGNPIPVRRSIARMMGANFEATGVSSHTRFGQTLWVVLAYAQYKGIGVMLKGSPEDGWAVTKTH